MKSELKRRNLSALGPKAQLVARLKPHLDAVIAAAEGTPAAAAAKVVRNSKFFLYRVKIETMGYILSAFSKFIILCTYGVIHFQPELLEYPEQI